MNYTILIADDEESILELMEYNLTKEGYNVFCAKDGKEALILAQKVQPDLIILDVMMPVMDGIETCEELRKIKDFQSTLILFSSARSEDFTQLSAYNVGADDYVVKPIKIKLFLSRIKALLKRSGKNLNTSIISVADLSIDNEGHKLHKAGVEIVLVKKEFKLLNLLVSKPGKVFSRDEIINQVWESDVVVGNRTIDVHIRKLREKIGSDYFLTLKGVGYKFNDHLLSRFG